MDPSDEKAFAENGFSVSEEDAEKAAAEAKAGVGRVVRSTTNAKWQRRQFSESFAHTYLYGFDRWFNGH
jgi:hypothetical protein